jgi:hypothetical protein
MNHSSKRTSPIALRMNFSSALCIYIKHQTSNIKHRRVRGLPNSSFLVGSPPALFPSEKGSVTLKLHPKIAKME